MMTRDPKRRCLAYVVAGVIVQLLIVLLFVFLVMRVRVPKLRLSSVSVGNLTASSVDLDARLAVKNTNFGHFKFNATTATFSYRGSPAGTATVAGATAFARSTKKQRVAAHLALKGGAKDGRAVVTASARIDGEVHLLKAFKRKRSAEMDCTMEVDVESSKVKNLKCK